MWYTISWATTGVWKRHGTTSVVLDAGGAKVAESRHYPYGGERWTGGAMPTDYRWTGQRSESSLGLYQMGARFYDPALGRWLSADTLVPEPGEPQAFNRYSYVRGNPLKLIDPTGHQDTPPPTDNENQNEDEEFEMFWFWELGKIDAIGLRFNGSWSPFGVLLAINGSVDVIYHVSDEKLGIFITPGGTGGAFVGPGDVSIGILGVSDLPSIEEYSDWAGIGGACTAVEEVGGFAEWGIGFSENSEGKKTQSWALGWSAGAELAVYGGVGKTMQYAEIDKNLQATIFPGGVQILGHQIIPEVYIDLKSLFGSY